MDQPTQSANQPQIPGERAPMQSGRPAVSKWLWITLIIVVLVAGGYFGWYYLYGPGKTVSSNDATTTTTTAPAKTTATTTAATSATADWKTFTLGFSKGTFKYPTDWNLTKEDSSTAQMNYYTINKSATTSAGYVYEFNLSEWIKGPTEDGYALSVEKRTEALNLMKEIYQNQAISETTAQKFTGLGLEFFPYTNADLAGLKYIASSDNQSRGFSVIGTHGQDLGVAGQYVVSLYNPTKNVVVTYSYRVNKDNSAPEFKVYQDKMSVAYNNADGGAAVDEQNHKDFIALIDSTVRSKLSFGTLMDKVDLVAKTLSF